MEVVNILLLYEQLFCFYSNFEQNLTGLDVNNGLLYKISILYEAIQITTMDFFHTKCVTSRQSKIPISVFLLAINS